MTSSVAQIGARPFRAARPGCAPVVRRLTLPVGRRDSQGASFGVSRAARRGRGSVGRSDGQTSVAARRAALLLAVKRTPSLPAMLIRSGSLSTRPTLEHCSAKCVTNAAIRGFVPSRCRLLGCRLNCRICGIGVLHLAGLTNSAEYRLRLLTQTLVRQPPSDGRLRSPRRAWHHASMAEAPTPGEAASVVSWLHRQALEGVDAGTILEGLCARLLAGGLDLERAVVGFLVFHPQFDAINFSWACSCCERASCHSRIGCIDSRDRIRAPCCPMK
jgi:hypothetical protein